MADWVAGAAFLWLVVYTHGAIAAFVYLRGQRRKRSMRTLLSDLLMSVGWMMVLFTVLTEIKEALDSVEEEIKKEG